MKHLPVIFYLLLLNSCNLIESNNQSKTISQSDSTSYDSSVVSENTQVALNQPGVKKQQVSIFNDQDSLVNAYSTSFTLRTRGKVLEYVYSNSNPTQFDVSVNDLFEVFDDSLSAYDYDTCALVAVDTIIHKGKMLNIKKYKFLEKDDGSYLLFNEQFGILRIEQASEKIDYGTDLIQIP